MTDGHLVETAASVTYSTAVSRDLVRILLLAAALNGLEVKGADIYGEEIGQDWIPVYSC